jgi:hypothetical protein
MGGHRGGEVASHVALDAMEELETDAAGSLADRVRRANRAVWDRASGDEHLTGMVTEDQIQAILEAGIEPQQAAERLVRAANRAGGVDNISVVVLAATAEGGEAERPRRSAPRADRRTVLRWAVRIGVPVLVLLVLLFGARWYLDRQWYVGPSEGRVAIFQGIPLTVLGYDLGHPVQTFEDLPAAQVRRLVGERYPTFDEGIPLPSLAEAQEQVEQIREDLEEARRQARREARERVADGGGGG